MSNLVQSTICLPLHIWDAIDSQLKGRYKSRSHYIADMLDSPNRCILELRRHLDRRDKVIRQQSDTIELLQNLVTDGGKL